MGFIDNIKVFFKNMSRVNSANYIGTCRFAGNPTVCEFVSIENGNIVIWSNKGEDKIFSKSDFSDVRVVAYTVTQQGLQLIIGANVKGQKMAFQLEYTHLSQSVEPGTFGKQENIDLMIANGNRANRIQYFLNTIGSPIIACGTDWTNTKKIIMHNNVSIIDSYQMIMSAYKD